MPDIRKILLDPKDVPAELRPCFEETEVRCGAAWERVVERKTASPGQSPGYMRDCTRRNDGERAGGFIDHSAQTLGWRATCSCPRHAPTPQTVLDPFSGAATTGLVALQHGRRYIGLELQESYLEMSARRLASAFPQKKAA